MAETRDVSSFSVRPEWRSYPQSGDHFFQVGIKIQGNFGILKKKVSFRKIFQNNQVEISKKWGFMKNGGEM